jgi:hypothetical protein
MTSRFNAVPLNRTVVLVLVGVLAFAAISAFAASHSSPQGTTFYACRAAQTGTLYDVTTQGPPACRQGDSVLSWTSYDVIALDDAYVNEGQVDSIISAMIVDGAVGETELADGSVTTDKLAEGSVISAKLADGSVTTNKLADGSVVMGKIADGSITTVKLADNSVTTAKLADGSVTAGKVDSSSVQTRVSGTCETGSAIRTVASDGTVTCQPIGGVNVYVRESGNSTISPNNITGIFTRTCDHADHRAINGGVQWVSGAHVSYMHIAQSYRHPTNPHQWVLGVTNRHVFSSITVRASVICLSQ